ncbi:MAG TPA: DUF2961 domain-containing protein [Candidatus Polarisedimenticolia bacterium]|nr:DUF2961 domain-containing protein [Candidatus Polarisedimenticolia bacterium]
MKRQPIGRFIGTVLVVLGLLDCFILLANIAKAGEPPAIPIGLDAYRKWERWPYQRIGERAYMRSTYDRSGGNEGADGSHFLYQLSDSNNITLDVAGPGVLYFARFNHWHGSPWHYIVDGADHLIKESSTADPNHPVPGSVYIPSAPFPEPLAFTWSATKGADLNWVPISFEKSFCMGYSRTHYGTGYYIYHQFVEGIPLSQPIKAWDGKMPATDVLDLINRAGTDLAPPVNTPGVVQVSGDVPALSKNATMLLQKITPKKPAMLRALEISAPRAEAIPLSSARLRVTWDGESSPSIDAPVALFFGAGTLYNRDNREYLVKAFPLTIRFAQERVYLACYFPMPFFRSARIELIGNGSSDLTGLHWSARYQPYRDPQNQVGYFHATYRDHAHPVLGQDLVLLDTRETEGGGDWSGSFVGTSFIFSDRANLTTLEGDPRFFFDDSQTPQAQGTGTEEWGGGGDYWGGQNMTLPFAGHPTGAPNKKSAQNSEDMVESAYRILLADLMPFGKNALIRLEHGGANTSTEHYRTVAYWYGSHGASLVKTDTLKIGDAASEAAHKYFSPQASEPYQITSRYEWGPDTVSNVVNGSTGTITNVECFPATTDEGRKTTGTSEFTLKLDPKNVGVLLRRKLDYQFPNQRAEVFIAGEKGGDWKFAGIWYLAGSSTCVRSYPKAELGAADHQVQTSNRRFRDDEFLVSRRLTAGRSAIRVRVKFTPSNIPLFPGRPLDEQAWSEIRYDAYSFIVPHEKSF